MENRENSYGSSHSENNEWMRADSNENQWQNRQESESEEDSMDLQSYDYETESQSETESESDESWFSSDNDEEEDLRTKPGTEDTPQQDWGTVDPQNEVGYDRDMDPSGPGSAV